MTEGSCFILGMAVGRRLFDWELPAGHVYAVGGEGSCCVWGTWKRPVWQEPSEQGRE